MPLIGPSAAVLNARVHLLDGHRLLHDHGEVGERDVGRRNADRDAVDLALELGNHERRRLGGAGRRRDDRHRGGAGAAQVLVRQVEDGLVVRVAVDVTIDPRTKPKLSRMTFTIGTRQFVVHDAFEMIVCFAGSYFASFTPITIVSPRPWPARR